MIDFAKRLLIEDFYLEFPAFGWLGLGFHFVKKGAEQD
jgi:hypothetical protein